MYRKCLNDTDYAMKPVPETRQFKEAVPVEAKLNPVAKKTMGSRSLRVYSGPRQTSLSEGEMEKMDNLTDGVQQLAM